jgi:hypothetical protein
MKKAILALVLVFGLTASAHAADCTATTGKDVVKLSPGAKIYLVKLIEQDGPAPFARKAGVLECRGSVSPHQVKVIARSVGAQIAVNTAPGTWDLYNPLETAQGTEFWSKQ